MPSDISPLPITLKDLIKHPLPSMLLVCLIAISGLYLRSEKIRNNMDSERKSTIQTCVDKTDRLSTEVSFLTEQVRRSDSALADVRATIRTLKEAGRIQ